MNTVKILSSLTKKLFFNILRKLHRDVKQYSLPQFTFLVFTKISTGNKNIFFFFCNIKIMFNTYYVLITNQDTTFSTINTGYFIIYVYETVVLQKYYRFDVNNNSV